jgi:transposase
VATADEGPIQAAGSAGAFRLAAAAQPIKLDTQVRLFVEGLVALSRHGVQIGMDQGQNVVVVLFEPGQERGVLGRRHHVGFRLLQQVGDVIPQARPDTRAADRRRGGGRTRFQCRES